MFFSMRLNFLFHLLSHLSSSSSTATNVPTWFSNQFYLHSTNQTSLLGSYPSSYVTLPFDTSPQHFFATLESSPLAISPSSPFVVSLSVEPSILSKLSPLPKSLPTLPTSAITTPSTFQPNPTSNSHHMQTRSKSWITKPKSKLCYKVVMDYTYTKPPCYKITSQYPKQCEAMDAKFLALQRQQTWSLVLHLLM